LVGAEFSFAALLVFEFESEFEFGSVALALELLGAVATLALLAFLLRKTFGTSNANTIPSPTSPSNKAPMIPTTQGQVLRRSVAGGNEPGG
jgi:hypothetical protein